MVLYLGNELSSNIRDGIMMDFQKITKASKDYKKNYGNLSVNAWIFNRWAIAIGILVISFCLGHYIY